MLNKRNTIRQEKQKYNRYDAKLSYIDPGGSYYYDNGTDYQITRDCTCNQLCRSGAWSHAAHEVKLEITGKPER